MMIPLVGISLFSRNIRVLTSKLVVHRVYYMHHFICVFHLVLFSRFLSKDCVFACGSSCYDKVFYIFSTYFVVLVAYVVFWWWWLVNRAVNL